MGYRSQVAYFIKFYKEDEPEKAHADFVRFHAWLKQHKVPRDAETHAEMKDGSFYSLETELNALSKNKEGEYAWALHIIASESCITFTADDVKWYDSYPEVQWHMQLLQEVANYDTGNYTYFRVGEDYTDVEHNYHITTYHDIFDRLDVSRQIEVNFPSPDPETEDSHE